MILTAFIYAVGVNCFTIFGNARWSRTILESFADFHLTARTWHHKIIGIPPETRTPTKGFGDPRAAITPARQYSNYTIFLISSIVNILPLSSEVSVSIFL